MQYEDFHKIPRLEPTEDQFHAVRHFSPRYFKTLEHCLPMSALRSRVLLEKLSLSAIQQIPRLLCNPKVHYRVHNSPPPVPIPSQVHSVHTFPPCFPKIHSNIILPSTPRSSQWSHPFRFSNQNILRVPIVHACYMPRPSHHPNNIWCRVQVTEPLVMQFSLTPHPVISSLLGRSFNQKKILLNASFCNFLRSLLVRSSYVRMFSSTICSQTLSVYAFPLE
jgi:hypothetical protein